MPSLFDKLNKEMTAAGIKPRTEAARGFIGAQLSKLKIPSNRSNLLNDAKRISSQAFVGRMYLYHYDPKLKDILPTAKDLKDGMAIYEQWFTPDRMKEYNIVSFTMEDPSGHQKSSKSHKSSRPHKSGGPHKADGGRARAKSKARAKSRSRSRSRSKRSNSKSKSKK